MLIWQEFLEHFNGVLTGDYLQLFTDAAGSIGYGAECRPECFFGKWPLSWLTELELYPIMTAVETWGREWMNSSV